LLYANATQSEVYFINFDYSFSLPAKSVKMQQRIAVKDIK
jgi:hypothetical protein